MDGIGWMDGRMNKNYPNRSNVMCGHVHHSIRPGADIDFQHSVSDVTEIFNTAQVSCFIIFFTV